MAGGSVTLTPDQAIDDLAAIRQIVQAAPLADAMRDCAAIVRESIGENFAGESAPDGPGWPPRKIIGDGHPLLNDTGFLKAAALGVGPGAITDVQGRVVELGIDDSVELGGIPGAAAHNYGYPPNNLPQREFFAPADSALDACEDAIGDAVERRIDGGGRIGGGA